MSRFPRGPIRKFLEYRGYWTRHRSVLPFGIEYQHDIRRLCIGLGLSVEVFFDVGANVGQTSLAALSNFPTATIFAFEPTQSTFEMLVRNVDDHRCRHHNIALSDRTGEAQFFDYGASATSNSLVLDSQYGVRTQHPVNTTTVKCETLDSFCDRMNISRIDVLKIDTEGHEMNVLHGALSMLSARRVRFVYAEFNTLAPKNGTTGGALLPIGELLESMGFRFVATFPEYLIMTKDLFVTSNALFVNTL